KRQPLIESCQAAQLSHPQRVLDAFDQYGDIRIKARENAVVRKPSFGLSVEPYQPVLNRVDIRDDFVDRQTALREPYMSCWRKAGDRRDDGGVGAIASGISQGLRATGLAQ